MALKRPKKNGTLGKRIARATESTAFKKAASKLIRTRTGRGLVKELLDTGIEARAASNVTQKKRLLAKERKLRKRVQRGR